MQTKIVTCPGPRCHAILQVRNSMNEEVKHVTCPLCRTRFDVNFKETIVAPGIQSGAKIYIVCGDKKYRLRKKSNIVGRKPTVVMDGPVEADIQLEINDDYMSRLSAIVNVTETDNGVLVTITPHPNNMNRILVGEYELKKGDEVLLTDGTELTMGITKMTLSVVERENENRKQ